MSNFLRPHWIHKHCCGIVVGIGDIFKCGKCDLAGVAVGTVLPRDVGNRAEYFAAHPELEVILLTLEELSAHPEAPITLR